MRGAASVRRVPKSRRRKPPSRRARAAGRSGDPRRTGPSAVERAAAAVGELIKAVDPSDPLLVTAVPAWFLALLTAGEVPAERCADDCVILAHAYAQLGIAAQVRTAEVTVTDRATGLGQVFGTPTPRWRDGLLDGHTALWLPDVDQLVDTTAGQYPALAALHAGPVIAQLYGSQDRTAGESRAGFTATVALDTADLHYALAPLATSLAVLDHPVMAQEEDGNQRRGGNVAALTVCLLADHLPPDHSRHLAHPRAAALVDAVRPLPRWQTPQGDWRFAVADTHSAPMLRPLADVPVPDGTGPALSWP